MAALPLASWRHCRMIRSLFSWQSVNAEITPGAGPGTVFVSAKPTGRTMSAYITRAVAASSSPGIDAGCRRLFVPQSDLAHLLYMR